jgi:1,4-alpha-glucan branching enzyme
VPHFPPHIVAALQEGVWPTPFDVLGIHPATEGGPASGAADPPTPAAPPSEASAPTPPKPHLPSAWIVRVFLPWARSVHLLHHGEETPMEPAPPAGGAFQLLVEAPAIFPYRLRVEDPEGRWWEMEDPYRFPPALDESRIREFLVGREKRIHQVLGAHPCTLLGVKGTLFGVWAPHARAVGLMGDMNGWDPRCHPMRPRGDTGAWELFVPEVGQGARYKYRVVGADGVIRDKSDPLGRAMQLRPDSASVVVEGASPDASPETSPDAGPDAAPDADTSPPPSSETAPETFPWTDQAWMAERPWRQADEAPISIYEVHLGSWRRRHGRWLTYGELADELLPHVKALGFTHIELLPILEHPLDESWGYQPVGYFAPTARHGTPHEFRAFVDRAHRLGLGVLLDWVPGHFPDDAHGLGSFDGTPLFEAADPKLRRHPDWGTLTFDFGRPTVRALLVASALHWLEDYHLDGIRVDAVASMLYLDYSRKAGEWTPNPQGGRENLEAVAFLRELNDAVHAACPGVLMSAEESTAWPRVSHGTDRGGLGFSQKWNMGWMNDTLEAMGTDPLFRSGVYDRFTFSLLYAFSERFVLPLSHDEVVHGKGSLASKMPGTPAEKLANLRALLALQWAHPGKKLLFMGGELGQWSEWDAMGSLEWGLLEGPAGEGAEPGDPGAGGAGPGAAGPDDGEPGAGGPGGQAPGVGGADDGEPGAAAHRGIGRLVEDLNRLYREAPALHRQDYRPEGFEWLECHDPARVILAFLRWAPEYTDPVVVVANLTPVDRPDYRLPVPWPGHYRIVLNTDAPDYGGPGALPLPPRVEAVAEPRGGKSHSLPLPLPGLSVLFLRPEGATDSGAGGERGGPGS